MKIQSNIELGQNLTVENKYFWLGIPNYESVIHFKCESIDRERDGSRDVCSQCLWGNYIVNVLDVVPITINPFRPRCVGRKDYGTINSEDAFQMFRRSLK